MPPPEFSAPMPPSEPPLPPPPALPLPKSLFISNLPSVIDENALRMLFSAWNVTAARVKHKEGKPSFGFVDFRTHDDAERALSEKHFVGGVLLSIVYSTNPKAIKQRPPNFKNSERCNSPQSLGDNSVSNQYQKKAKDTAPRPNKKGEKQRKNKNSAKEEPGAHEETTYNILVVGKSGAGKSTVINVIANYFLGGTLDNLRVVIPTKFQTITEKPYVGMGSETNVSDRTQSQTSNCTPYTFVRKTSLGNEKFVFIDTPGLSDSRGIGQDDVNISKILDGAIHYAISAVVLVANGTEGRVDTSTANSFNRLSGVIPDSFLKRATILVLTKARQSDCCFEFSSVNWLEKVRVAYMNNGAFSSNPSSWSPQDKKHQAEAWDESMGVIDCLVRTIRLISTSGTDDFLKLRNKRFEIKQQLHEARLEISQLHQLQDEIEKLEKDKANSLQTAKSFCDYTQTKVITRTELVDASYHSTICSTCNVVCHDHCGLQEITGVGDNAFKSCLAMTGDNCHQCPGKCSYKMHYHGKKTMRKTETTLNEVLQDIKSKFDSSIATANALSSMIYDSASAKKQINAMIDYRVKQLFKKCYEIRDLCSGFNLVDELFITIQQMQQEARNYKAFEARDKAESIISVIKSLCKEFEGRTESSRPPLKPLNVINIADTFSNLEEGDSSGSEESKNDSEAAKTFKFAHVTSSF